MLSASICPLSWLLFTNMKDYGLKKKKQDPIYLKVYSGFYNTLINNNGCIYSFEAIWKLGF